MEQKRTVVDHFDRLAEGDQWSALYDEQADPRRAYNFVVRRRRVEELSAEAARPGARVLDIGCGTAVLAPFYLERGCEYCGTDISRPMLAAARERVPSERASFRLGDVEAGLGFPPGHFHLVLGLGLLEYLDAPDRAVAEMVRLARPGGTLIVSVPYRRSVNHLATRLLSPVVSPAWRAVKWILRRPHEPHRVRHRRYVARELEALFARHGAVATGQAYYNLEVLAYPLHRLLPGLAHRVKRRVERHHASWVHVFATGYVLRCRAPGGEEDTVP